MQPLTDFTGTAALLDRANVDTDAIIPKQFLKRVPRTGYGPFLFYDWRYLSETICSIDQEKCDFVLSEILTNPEFELNKPQFAGASILIARNNFGCGSSREHAVWALLQDGYKAIIAPKVNDIPGFADIFRNNALKNGLLPIELSEEQVNELFAIVETDPSASFSISLEKQEVEVTSSTGTKLYTFAIDDGPKDRLLKGLDDIGMTMEHEEAIAKYEQRNPQVI